METWFKQIKGHVYFCILILVSVFSIWKRILEEQGPGWASPWRNINRQLCAGCRGASAVKLVVDLAISLFVCVNIGNKWTYSYFHTLASNNVPGRPLLCNVTRHNVTMLELHKFKWSPSLLTAHTAAHSSPPSTDTGNMIQATICTCTMAMQDEDGPQSLFPLIRIFCDNMVLST